MPNRLKSSAASYMASGARRDVGNAIDCLIVCSPTCRTGRVQSKYANVLSVKRRFDGISAHFVPAVDVVSVPVPVFRCLRWFGLFSLLLLFKFLSSHQVRRHACRLLQISSSFLARHTSISARTARPGRHRSRCWSLIYMHKFCVWFAPVYDALI